MLKDRFSGLAQEYANYALTYPTSAIRNIFKQYNICEQDVLVDIGSGTGLLTQELLFQNNKVFAVEPNDEMRQEAEKNLGKRENFFSLKATAEITTILPKTIDFIFVGQAFHWFDFEKFLVESKRIMKQEGMVILIWNNLVLPVNTKNQLVNKIKDYCPNYIDFPQGNSGENIDNIKLFYRNSEYDKYNFSSELLLNREQFIGKYLSTSYAPRRESPNYKKYRKMLGDFFLEVSCNQTVKCTHKTNIYVGRI